MIQNISTKSQYHQCIRYLNYVHSHSQYVSEWKVRKRYTRTYYLRVSGTRSECSDLSVEACICTGLSSIDIGSWVVDTTQPALHAIKGRWMGLYQNTRLKARPP